MNFSVFVWGAFICGVRYLQIQQLSNFVTTLDPISIISVKRRADNEPHYLQGDTQPNHPGQILLPPLHTKLSLSALWSDKANPASLFSISTCCTTSTHSWKRKAPVFHSTSLGLPPPPSHTPFGGDNPVIIPSSPCKPPYFTPHFCTALRPLLSPLPFTMSYITLTPAHQSASIG